MVRYPRPTGGLRETVAARVTTVLAGQELTFPSWWDPALPRTYVVKPRCGPYAEGSTTGQWVCVTHGEAFRNNLEASFHEGDDKEHVVGWLCAEHGLEVP